MRFNEYLKSCREQNEFTQEQLVHNLYSYDINSFEGLDTSALSKWERGVTKPKISKQISIIKYFQTRTGMALPCWNDYSTQEAEDLICRLGVRNLIGKRKELIGNFPSKLMSVDDIQVYPWRNFGKMNAIIESSMHIQYGFHHLFTHISREQHKEWAIHPSNLFLVCEHKECFLGLLISIRVKPKVFDRVVNFEMKKSEIAENDFASFDEMGSILMAGFYALNEKAAMMLVIRFYAHLITNQKSIAEIGGLTISNEARKIASNMNLHSHASKIIDGTKIESFRETLSGSFASEYAVKMLLAKQECPEE